MDKNHRMEHFSKAFIRAFAAPLGFNHSIPELDNDSIDIKLLGKNYNGRFRSPEIHVQLKSTCDSFHNGGYLPFKLKKKNYEDLRGTNVAFPRYLFVYSLPAITHDWLVEKVSNVELFNNGYWYSLRQAPPLKGQKSKVIHVPQSNLITKTVLEHMMQLASNGDSL